MLSLYINVSLMSEIANLIQLESPYKPTNHSNDCKDYYVATSLVT